MGTTVAENKSDPMWINEFLLPQLSKLTDIDLKKMTVYELGQRFPSIFSKTSGLEVLFEQADWTKCPIGHSRDFIENDMDVKTGSVELRTSGGEAGKRTARVNFEGKTGEGRVAVFNKFAPEDSDDRFMYFVIPYKIHKGGCISISVDENGKLIGWKWPKYRVSRSEFFYNKKNVDYLNR